jgi:hypothetical protein
LYGVEQEVDAVEVALGGGQVQGRPSVVVGNVQVDVAEPGPDTVEIYKSDKLL